MTKLAKQFMYLEFDSRYIDDKDLNGPKNCLVCRKTFALRSWGWWVLNADWNDDHEGYMEEGFICYTCARRKFKVK